MKLRKLHIDNYKMFKDFDIDFVDKEDNPLPIIVIAGINGSGKTTLLEYIFKDNFLNIGPFYAENSNYIEFIDNNKIKTLNNEARKKKKEIDDYLKKISEKDGIAGISYDDNGLFLYDIDKYIMYIKAMDNDIKDIKKSILEYYRKKSRDLDSHSKALKEIQSFFKNIFDSLGLSFNIEDIDDIVQNQEKVIFKNKMGETLPIESLSTGEKTLLSKVLYLYLKEIKDSVILIDEPELSLHPAWQNRVLKLYENFAKENNCQIIIATHSPHIIGSARNEYIRVLTINEEDEVEVINDVLAYGRDIEWVLEEVMGATSTREVTVAKKIKECEELLNEDKYDEAEELIDALEILIGENDSEIMSLRNSLEFWRE